MILDRTGGTRGGRDRKWPIFDIKYVRTHAVGGRNCLFLLQNSNLTIYEMTSIVKTTWAIPWMRQLEDGKEARALHRTAMIAIASYSLLHTYRAIAISDRTFSRAHNRAGRDLKWWSRPKENLEETHKLSEEEIRGKQRMESRMIDEELWVSC